MSAPHPSTPEPLPIPHDYRLDPRTTVRLMGSVLVLLALLVFGVTLAVALLELTQDLIVIVVAAGLLAVFTLGWWLRSRAWVMRAEADGYRIGLVRGAGVRAARWKDVESASTATYDGIDCVVLTLRDDAGGTTIPVEVLALDREQFVRELQQRLQAGQGYRAL